MAGAQSVRGAYRDRLWARIVLVAVAGMANAAIAVQAGVHVDTAASDSAGSLLPGWQG